MNQEKIPLIANSETVNALCDMFVEVINEELRGELTEAVKQVYSHFAFELYIRGIIPVSYLREVAMRLTPDIHKAYLLEGLYED